MGKTKMRKRALILVDIQNDFCAGGSLAVPGGDEVVPIINLLQPEFDYVIATQDWHPTDHTSFAANHPNYAVGDVLMLNNISQILWPIHCVQNSRGAEFHPLLDKHYIKKIFHKGADKEIDSYSAFFDNAHLRSTGLGDYLKQENVEEVYIAGLATDYCVKFSAFDATYLGFDVYVITDACRGVELRSGDIENAFEEMAQRGAKLITSSEIPSSIR